jgi:hypothetical protein
LTTFLCHCKIFPLLEFFTLRDFFRQLGSLLDSDFDVERFLPLLNAILRIEPDEVIWEKVYATVAEPPRLLPLHIQQTPHLRNTSSFLNSSEHRKYVDDVLEEELGPLYAGIPGFYKTFFGKWKVLRR